ncbi:MAG: hypothetical protein IPK52_26080 [Chloroflexi bacterium]|nr:hypothetical protein [Chloroflexota bacterium]
MNGFYAGNERSDRHQTAVNNARRKNRKPPKREHRLIAFKAFLDTDREIVNWWEGMEDGARSDVIRALLHSYIEGLPMYEAAQRKLIPVDSNTVREVHDNTRWIRDALSEMPAYLERLLGRLEATRSPEAVSHPEPAVHEGGLTPEAQARRMAKMEKANW